jgi:hypothetical protein
VRTPRAAREACCAAVFALMIPMWFPQQLGKGTLAISGCLLVGRAAQR